MKKRASGILLHITSLPGRYGIGDFGRGAYAFADFLHKSKQNFWQILPLTPPITQIGNSPYDCLSAFAGNTMLISPELLCESGFLRKEDLAAAPKFETEKVNYEKVAGFKKELLDKAVEEFRRKGDQSEFNLFRSENKDWLEDHAVFESLTEHFGTSDWSRWPRPIRDRRTGSINEIRGNLKSGIEKREILQYFFFKQWLSLKKYCNDRGISIIGDIPLYVSYQSSDVWANQGMFKLNKTGKPAFISGVPPDFFSKTGQLWGNPVYNWPQMEKNGFRWWMQRIRHDLTLYDFVRIDHFRGLVKYWQVRAGSKTAEKGKWVEGPGEKFFDILFMHFPSAPLILEDLGHITPDVRELVLKLKLPGMRVLLFAFDSLSGRNMHLPHNHVEDCILYTGTHDNNTVRGWFEHETDEKQRKALFAYLGREISADELPWELIRLAMMSVARTVIIPMQDFLALGPEGRMNRPASMRDNWRWRLREEQLSEHLAHRLAKITELYGRAAGF